MVQTSQILLVNLLSFLNFFTFFTFFILVSTLLSLFALSFSRLSSLQQRFEFFNRQVTIFVGIEHVEVSFHIILNTFYLIQNNEANEEVLEFFECDLFILISICLFDIKSIGIHVLSVFILLVTLCISIEILNLFSLSCSFSFFVFMLSFQISFGLNLNFYFRIRLNMLLSGLCIVGVHCEAQKCEQNNSQKSQSTYHSNNIYKLTNITNLKTGNKLFVTHHVFGLNCTKNEYYHSTDKMINIRYVAINYYLQIHIQ